MASRDLREAQRLFEDVAVGQRYEQTQHPTRERVLAYIALAGIVDADGRITDLERSRTFGLERPLVPSQMTFNIVTRLVSDWTGTLGRIAHVDISYRRPIFHDDVLRCAVLVTDVEGDGEYEDQPEGAVHLDLSIHNERAEDAVLGTAIVLMPRRG